MQFFDYKETPPSKPGRYLWVENNWNATNIDGEPVHHLSVRIARYADGRWDGDECRGLIDPDQWAEVPLPDVPPKPDYTPDMAAIRERAFEKLTAREREALST